MVTSSPTGHHVSGSISVYALGLIFSRGLFHVTYEIARSEHVNIEKKNHIVLETETEDETGYSNSNKNTIQDSHDIL